MRGVGIHGLQHSPEVAPGDLCAHPPLTAYLEGLTGLQPPHKLAGGTDNGPWPRQESLPLSMDTQRLGNQSAGDVRVTLGRVPERVPGLLAEA